MSSYCIGQQQHYNVTVKKKDALRLCVGFVLLIS